MIRTSVLFNLRDFDDVSEMIAEFPDLYFSIVHGAYSEQIAPLMLAKLRQYPPPVKRPFQFATAKSRRYWFAVLAKKYPNGYQRTGKLADAWKINLDLWDGDLVLSASNSRKYYKWVQGDRQVPGHANTGWQLAAPIFNFYRDEALEVARVSLHQAVRAA